jgi:tetratricopeptide (TPR) repeat protein
MATPECAACGTELIVSGPCVFCGHDPATPVTAPAEVELASPPDTAGSGFELQGPPDTAAVPDPVLEDIPSDAAAGFEEELATEMAEFGGDDLIVGDGEVKETLVPTEQLSTDIHSLTDLQEMLDDSSEEDEEFEMLLEQVSAEGAELPEPEPEDAVEAAAEEEEEEIFLIDDDDDDGDEEEILIDLDGDDDDGEEILLDTGDDEEEILIDADDESTQAGESGLSAEEEAALMAALDDDDDDLLLDDDDDDDSSEEATGVEDGGLSAEEEAALMAALDDDDDDDGLFDDSDEGAPVVITPPPPPVGAEEPAELGDDFLEAETGLVQQLIVPSAIHVDADTAAMLEPECVLGPIEGFVEAGLSVFEQTVFGLINSKRTNARIAKRCGLSFDDLRIALALLADKHAIQLVGHARKKDAPAKADAPPKAGDDDGWRMSFDDDEPAEPNAPASAPMPLDAADLGLELIPNPVAEDPPPEMTPMPAIAQDYFEEGLMGLPGFDEPSVAPVPQAAATFMPTPERARVIVKDEPVMNKPAIKPRDVLLYEQARDEEMDGEFEKALKLLEEAAKLNPKAAPVFNRMGVLLATKMGQVGKGMDAITKALEIDPHNETYQKNLNVVLSRIDSDDEPASKKPKDGLMGRLFKK